MSGQSATVLTSGHGNTLLIITCYKQAITTRKTSCWPIPRVLLRQPTAPVAPHAQPRQPALS